MKIGLASAAALSFALAQIAAPAYAETAGQFRSAEAQAFSTAELQRFGLSSTDADQIAAMQEQGYEVQVLSPQEASQYTAGQYEDNRTMWLVIGGVILIVIVAAAVS